MTRRASYKAEAPASACELGLTKNTIESILNVLKSRLQSRWSDLSGE